MKHIKYAYLFMLSRRDFLFNLNTKMAIHGMAIAFDYQVNYKKIIIKSPSTEDWLLDMEAK